MYGILIAHIIRLQQSFDGSQRLCEVNMGQNIVYGEVKPTEVKM